jgi:hypothetical protein
MLAHACSSSRPATTRTAPTPMATTGLILLTCQEVARLLNRTIFNPPRRRLTDALNWMYWRRRHQHRGRTSHYRRRPET